MSETRIHRDPKIMVGKPVIRGTRITVELLLRKLSAGATRQDIMDDYPGIDDTDISAALAYAADYLSHEGLIAAE